ncbi:MAG TPA: GNAT family protein [Anaerolineales bacterium]|nr:GNAT family protein [Anaerolineales bacterium]
MFQQPSDAPSAGSSDGRLRLETQRLVLREWTASDIPDLVEGLNDLGVAQWLALVPHPYTVEAAEQWLAYCARLAEAGPERTGYELAIELRSERKAIGGVSLTRISRLHGTAGGGIWLNAHYQGHGYGLEAFGEKIRFAFEDLGLRKLENGYFPGNTASQAMQEKLGYRPEGLRRQAYRCLADGLIKDECLTGLLIQEWQRPPRR